jgi:hypothetical protein
MTTRSRLFSCSHSAPAMFRLLAAVILAIVACEFAAAQQHPSFAVQPGIAAGLHQPSDLAFRRMKYFYEPRAYPFGRIPPGAYQAAVQDYKQKWGAPDQQLAPESSLKPVAITTTAWEPIGPAPIATSPTFSGRINSIAVHPFDPNVIYIGGAQGGVWKSVDGGASWVPLTVAVRRTTALIFTQARAPGRKS